MLSFGFLFVYLGPLFKQGVFKKKINQGGVFYQKIILIIGRIFVLLMLLIPAEIVPGHMASGNKDIELIFKNSTVVSLSYFEAKIIVISTVVWFGLAIYCYFKPSSYFLEN